MNQTDSTSQNDGPQFPEMRESVLSQAEVLALVADLQAFAGGIVTLCKSAARQETPQTNMPLDAAIERLLCRTVSAVQIRYSYSGHNWSDTLLCVPDGFRLVRCQHPNPVRTNTPESS